MCTASAQKLQEHVDSKHAKNGFEVIFSLLFQSSLQGKLVWFDTTTLLANVGTDKGVFSCRLVFPNQRRHNL